MLFAFWLVISLDAQRNIGFLRKVGFGCALLLENHGETMGNLCTGGIGSRHETYHADVTPQATPASHTSDASPLAHQSPLRRRSTTSTSTARQPRSSALAQQAEVNELARLAPYIDQLIRQTRNNPELADLHNAARALYQQLASRIGVGDPSLGGLDDFRSRIDQLSQQIARIVFESQPDNYSEPFDASSARFASDFMIQDGHAFHPANYSHPFDTSVRFPVENWFDGRNSGSDSG